MLENRRLVRLLVAAPLCLLALALALVAFNSQGEPAELAAKAVTQTAGLQVPAWGPPPPAPHMRAQARGSDILARRSVRNRRSSSSTSRRVL